MRQSLRYIFLFCCICNFPVAAQPPHSGGGTTVFVTNTNSFSKPATNLALTRRDSFFIGNSFFRNPWVSSPASTTARDGLGPLFNTNTCQSCHIKDGRGRPPLDNEIMTSMLVRVAIQGERKSKLSPEMGVVPDPNYGNQFQNRAIQGVQPEATIAIEWKQKEIKLNENESVFLRTPELQFKDLAYGPIHKDARFSARTAPVMIGIGLLEAIPISALEDIAKQQQNSNEGVSGRLNKVWDIQKQQTVAGRFGWKAGQPTVRQQVASAFAGDIGITSNLFPQQPCMPIQTACEKAPAGDQPEVNDEILEFVTFYSKTLAVPARRNINDQDVRQGEKLFRKINCAVCHVETLHTGIDPNFPELSNQEIHPYTDLLLHDMGEGLADHSSEFLATGREWRTPPLWGIGLLQTVNGHTNLLHDGRARNVEEAILWHGGEAEKSRQAYTDLSKKERSRLLRFIDSL